MAKISRMLRGRFKESQETQILLSQSLNRIWDAWDRSKMKHLGKVGVRLWLLRGVLGHSSLFSIESSGPEDVKRFVW